MAQSKTLSLQSVLEGVNHGGEYAHQNPPRTDKLRGPSAPPYKSFGLIHQYQAFFIYKEC